MSTPQRRAEASAASNTFHVAMAMLGAEAFATTLDLWQDVVPSSTRLSVTAARFYAAALKMVRLRRHQVQVIAVAYMRLARALHTDHTFQPLFEPEPEQVPISKLREDFVQAVEQYAPRALETGLIEDIHTDDEEDDSSEVLEPDGSPYTPYTATEWTEPDLPITVEEIEDLGELLDQLEDWAEQEAEAVLQALGEDLLRSKIDNLSEQGARIVEDTSGAEPRIIDDLREHAHGVVGRRVAAHAERLVQNGGRHAEHQVAWRDQRVIGYVRKHYPENDIHPCSFCAMLLSRGIVYKKGTSSTRDKARTAAAKQKTWDTWSEAFQVDGAEFDKFHPLCHCRGEAVYSKEQYDADPGFQVNREFEQLWKDHIRYKFSAKGAETEWRALLKSLNQASQERAEKENRDG